MGPDEAGPACNEEPSHLLEANPSSRRDLDPEPEGPPPGAGHIRIAGQRPSNGGEMPAASGSTVALKS